MKYKPTYKITLSGEELGYVQNKQAFEENLRQLILKDEDKNVDMMNITVEPEYKLTLIARDIKTNEQEIASKVQDEVVITYKYYEITLDNDVIETVDTLQEAEELINSIKQDNEKQDLNLSIIEKYTQNKEEIKTDEIEIAKNQMKNKIEEKENYITEVNGIKIAYLPVQGVITSRYGVSSRIRKSNHTGLDIAVSSGTPIKVVSSGKVTYAGYQGSYGNLVKVEHGQGVETWYAHTKEMYVTEGQEVKAGDVIAAVGSTGNSTGPHLHFEIRINGEHINPQNYIY